MEGTAVNTLLACMENYNEAVTVSYTHLTLPTILRV